MVAGMLGFLVGMALLICAFAFLTAVVFVFEVFRAFYNEVIRG